jgi:hypothetical protein
MICLFALLSAFAPRVAFFVLWIFTPLVDNAFGFWLWPLLGIIFLPLTTLMYALVVGQLGPTNVWGWLAVLFAFLIDSRFYVDIALNYERIPRRATAT